MEVLKVKTTESKEVADNWLHKWGISKADGIKQVRIKYERMYAEIVNEIPMFKIIETMLEIPQNDNTNEF